MSSENLDQRDFEGRNLAVHVDTGKVKLYLETNVHIGSVDSRTPPQSEAAVGDLIQTRPLSVGQLLELHRFLEPTGFFPKQTLPSREICAFKQGVFEDSLHTAQSLDHISTVVVEVPQFTVVLLMGPPEGVLLEHLVLLEVLPHTPSLIVGQS